MEVRESNDEQCSCPPISEYGGFNKLTEYCDNCLLQVAEISSSDWKHFQLVARKLLRSKTLKLTDDEIAWLQNTIK